MAKTGSRKAGQRIRFIGSSNEVLLEGELAGRDSLGALVQAIAESRWRVDDDQGVPVAHPGGLIGSPPRGRKEDTAASEGVAVEPS